MNHCYDCNSSYSTPGTCNCFAVGGKRYAVPSTWTTGATTLRYRSCGLCGGLHAIDVPHFCPMTSVAQPQTFYGWTTGGSSVVAT